MQFIIFHSTLVFYLDGFAHASVPFLRPYHQIYWWFCGLVAKLCPTLSDSMDCSLPGSSVHGISQAKRPEWVAIPSSRGSSQPREPLSPASPALQANSLVLSHDSRCFCLNWDESSSLLHYNFCFVLSFLSHFKNLLWWNTRNIKFTVFTIMKCSAQ